MKIQARYLHMNTKKPDLKIVALYHMHVELIDNITLPSCINCANWNNIKCEKFNLTPPAEIIAKSCGPDNWEHGIPF